MTEKEQKLHQAVQENNVNQVEALLGSGVNINCIYYGWTPLQFAIDRNHQDMAVMLMEKGCDILYHDKNHRSPFEEALLKQQCKVVEAMLNHKVKADQTISSGDSALCIAIEQENLEMVKILLKGNANPNSENKKHETALYLACQEGEADIANELIKAGASINHVQKENKNFTPLIVAVANDNEDVVKVLLKNKSELQIDAQDTDGWTALWHAYGNSNEDLCLLLLQAGASINLPNSDGTTIIDEAVENDDEDFVAMFTKYKRS